jgi:hypothetical protein
MKGSDFSYRNAVHQEVEDRKREWEERRQHYGGDDSDSGDEDDVEADRFLSQSP